MKKQAFATAPPDSEPTPLVIDLDGTLLRSDLLVESFFALVGAKPLSVLSLPSELARGKASLKAAIAREATIDASTLPYDERVLALIRDARSAGRAVHLASASNERYVAAVADHLGLFDRRFASTETENLSSAAKARRLIEAFGEKGFDYIGNDRSDLAVWAAARRRIAVHPPSPVRRALLAIDPEAIVIEPPAQRFEAWIRLLRVHQWAKNALILIPLITAQRLDAASIATALGAFLVFSFAASAIYVLNDLVDLDADRNHPRKNRRPLAAGALPVLQAMVVAPILVVLALAGALAIGPLFAGVLVAYLALTTAYSFSLKRKMMVDIIVLASLYTIRVMAGAAAVSVPISEWLLCFSMFIFTSLALIKRYVELAARADANLPNPSNRNYSKSDLEIVAALAAASGFNAVTVFALYVSSDTVRALYRHPMALWLICPILMYWLGRALLMAHRRLMHDDPIAFAMTDWNSWLAFALIGAIMIAAI